MWFDLPPHPLIKLPAIISGPELLGDFDETLGLREAVVRRQLLGAELGGIGLRLRRCVSRGYGRL